MKPRLLALQQEALLFTAALLQAPSVCLIEDPPCKILAGTLSTFSPGSNHKWGYMGAENSAGS